MTDRELRDAVFARAAGRCEYCRMLQACDPIPFELDHIIAQKHRGPTESDNLAVACFARNNHKGPNLAGIDPLLGVLVRLFHPRNDDWEDHFQLFGDGLLVGRSSIGRATVVVLEMNLPHRVAHRAALIEEGQLSTDA
jgi:hypothetical protein